MMRRSLRKNKKGSLDDLVVIAIFLFGFAVLVLIGFKLTDELNTKFKEDNTLTVANANVNNTMSQIRNLFPSVLDNSFLILVVGLAGMAMMMAALVRIHPVFFVFFVMFLAIVIFLCGIFSNVYQEIADTTEFASLAAELTFINAIMSYLPIFIGTFGMLLSMIMYKLWSVQAQEF